MANNNSANDRKNKCIFGRGLDFASKEAYNLLRTNISFACPDKDGGRVLGITSACSGEGKSTVALNLAYSLADAQSKVLLIDADMRRPTVFSSLGLPMSPGLSNVLAGNADIQLCSGKLHKNVDVLTSGDIPPNPSELIGSKKMGELLDEFHQKYDYVILDLPPVLSISDAAAVSGNVDGMVVVVRHGLTKRRDVVETTRQLGFVGAKVLGFVYNGIGRTRSKHYQRHRKYYGYD